MPSTTKTVPFRTKAAAREALIKEALKVVPKQTPRWHELSIQEQVALIRKHVEAAESNGGRHD